MKELKCFPLINNPTLNEVSEIYTYQVSNEHDKIFKDILNDKEEARKFINTYLKLKIPIPKVISIVLYTGHTKWKANLSFSDVQEKLEGYEEKDRSYTIIDINDFSNDDLLKDDLLVSKVLLLERSNSKEEFLKNAELARDNTPDDKLIKMDKILTVMLIKQFGEEEGLIILDNLKRKRGKGKMILAVEKMFERENRKLIRQGKLEGKKENTIEIAIKMLKEGLDIDLISKITNLRKEKIEKLKNSCK